MHGRLQKPQAAGSIPAPADAGWSNGGSVDVFPPLVAGFQSILSGECRWNYIITTDQVAGSTPARATIDGPVAQRIERDVPPILVAGSPTLTNLMKHTCPCCGYRVHDQPVGGSMEICPIWDRWAI